MSPATARSLAGFVYDGGGNASATLVRRCRIIGVWQPSEEPIASIRYHLFSGESKVARANVERELAAAGEMYFDRPIDLVEVSTMQPLGAGGGRSAMHCLDDRIHRASRRAR